MTCICLMLIFIVNFYDNFSAQLQQCFESLNGLDFNKFSITCIMYGDIVPQTNGTKL